MNRSVASRLRVGLALALAAISCASVQEEIDSEGDSPVGDELAASGPLAFTRRSIEREGGGLVRVDPATGARTALAPRDQTAALTFDCMFPRLGGSASSREILDVLRAKNVRTTLFVAGGCVFGSSLRAAYAAGESGVAAHLAVKTDARWAAFVRAMVEGGHEFGNHSVRHIINAQAMTPQDWEREMRVLHAGWDGTMKYLYGSSWAQTHPNAVMKNYWRAPGGDYGTGAVEPNTLRDAARGGFPVHVLWHLDTLDSVSGPPRGVSAEDWAADGNVSAPLRPEWHPDAAQMSRAVLSQASSGKGLIVLAHLSNPYHWGAPQFWAQRGGEEPAETLGDTVDGLRSRGYTVGTLSQVLGVTASPVIAGLSPIRGVTCNAALGCVWSSDCGRAPGYASYYPDANQTQFVCKKPGDGGCDPNLECELP